jgi:hypothetical protein
LYFVNRPILWGYEKSCPISGQLLFCLLLWTKSLSKPLFGVLH